jgi:hypothetical protein
MFKLIQRIPYWYLIAIPLLFTFLGAASNQLVLIANGDRFPVLVNQEQITKSCTPDSKTPEPDYFSILGPVTRVDPYACSNGGEFLDDTHVIMTDQSHLKILADIFDMHAATYSIGDFLLMLGSWMRDWAGIAWIVLVIRKFLE